MSAKVTISLLAASILTGCAAQPKPVISQTDAPIASSALAFDPPVTMNVTPLDLSRDTRGEAAFVGFEDSSITYFDQYSDDRRTTDNSDRLQRETYSERVGDIRR